MALSAQIYGGGMYTAVTLPSCLTVIPVVDHHGLRAWMARMSLGYEEASSRLGINKSTLAVSLKGISRTTNKPLPLPRTLQLAAMAIEAGLDEDLKEPFTHQDLRDWAERTGMTYDKGAEAFGVARSSYATWLTGVSRSTARPMKSLPRAVHLAALAIEHKLDLFLPEPFNPRSKEHINQLYREQQRAKAKEVF